MATSENPDAKLAQDFAEKIKEAPGRIGDRFVTFLAVMNNRLHQPNVTRGESNAVRVKALCILVAQELSKKYPEAERLFDVLMILFFEKMDKEFFPTP